MMHIFNPSYSGGRGRRIVNSKLAQAKLRRPYVKDKKKKKKDKGLSSDTDKLIRCRKLMNLLPKGVNLIIPKPISMKSLFDYEIILSNFYFFFHNPFIYRFSQH
jgi:hypothetical protein